jgi:hypothetical protein
LLLLLPWCSVSNPPLSLVSFRTSYSWDTPEEEVLRLGTLVPMNIEVPTKYPLSQDRIVVFEIRLHNKSPMLYRPALHTNWNALSLARRALKVKFPTPTIPLTTVLPNRQVFLSDPVYTPYHLWINTTSAHLTCVFSNPWHWAFWCTNENTRDIHLSWTQNYFP